MSFKAGDVEAQVRVNLIGAANSIEAVLPTMLERRQGQIVGISSLASFRGLPRMCGYCASKAALNALLEGVRLDVQPFGVTVTTICPGWIVPYRQEDVGPGSFWRRPGFENLGSPEDMQTALDEGRLPNIANLPIRRLGRPEDVAYLALYLASDVSSYVTGQLISVSGGAYMP